jgi:hypothetical protein
MDLCIGSDQILDPELQMRSTNIWVITIPWNENKALAGMKTHYENQYKGKL